MTEKMRLGPCTVTGDVAGWWRIKLRVLPYLLLYFFVFPPEWKALTWSDFIKV